MPIRHIRGFGPAHRTRNEEDGIDYITEVYGVKLLGEDEEFGDQPFEDKIDISQYQKLLKHWQENGRPHNGKTSFGHYYATARSLNRMYRALEQGWTDEKTAYWQYGWPTGRPPLKNEAAKESDKAAVDDGPNLPRLLVRQVMKLEHFESYPRYPVMLSGQAIPPQFVQLSDHNVRHVLSLVMKEVLKLEVLSVELLRPSLC